MISAIVLAAGQSRRMGVQKLLLPLGDRPVIRCVADELLASPVGGVVVVIAPQAEGIAAALAGCPVQLVVNPETGGDMLSSARCGLRALPADCQAALVALGDQPEISRQVVAELVRAFDAGGRIVVPTYGGRRGHPLLLSVKYREEILQQHDATGLRGLLLSHPQDVWEVGVTAPEILEDMDLPDDYRRIARRWR